MNLICIKVESDYIVRILNKKSVAGGPEESTNFFMYNISIMVNNNIVRGLEAETMEISNHS